MGQGPDQNSVVVLGMAEAGMTVAEEEVFDAALAAHASQLEASGDAAAAASSGSDSSSSGERPAPLPSPADLEHFAQFFPVSLAAIQARNRTGTSGRIAACDTHRRYAIAELSTRVLRGQLPSEDDLTHLRLPLAAKYGEAAKWPAAFAAWAARWQKRAGAGAQQSPQAAKAAVAQLLAAAAAHPSRHAAGSELPVGQSGPSYFAISRRSRAARRVRWRNAALSRNCLCRHLTP